MRSVQDPMADRTLPGSGSRNRTSRRAPNSCKLVCQEAARGTFRVVGGQPTHDAGVSGPGDVHQVGLERLERGVQARAMPPEQEVDRQIVLQVPAHRTAGEFEGGHRTALADCVLRPGVHREHGQPAAPGEAHELAAGKSHAVDLMKAVREERHAPAVHRITSSPG